MHRRSDRKKFYSSGAPFCRALESLEGRLLLSTVALPVVDPGFETLYKPGSTTVTATLASGDTTEGFLGSKVLVESLASASPTTVAYSDGTRGTSVDIPAWSVVPKQIISHNEPVAAILNDPGAYSGKGDNFASILFPPGGLANNAQIRQTLTGFALLPDTTYVLSCQIADGGIFNLDAGGTQIKATRSTTSNDNQYGFATVTKTYVTKADPMAGDLAIVLGNGGGTGVGAFDNVSLTASGADVSASPAASSELGTFGVISGKTHNLTLTEPDGTVANFSMTHGSGTATQSGSQVLLQVNPTSASAAVKITTSGGSKSVQLGAVTVAGPLASFTAPGATLAGAFSVAGSVKTLHVGAVTGNIQAASIAKLSAKTVSGTLDVAGAIGSLNLGAVTGVVASGATIGAVSAASFSDATLLAGTRLGADGMLGGGDDVYGPGSIGAISVKGIVAGTTVIAAGANPVDGVFGNGNDTAAAGSSSVKSILVRGAVDPTVRFEAGAFGPVKLANKPDKDLGSDSRFIFLT